VFSSAALDDVDDNEVIGPLSEPCPTGTKKVFGGGFEITGTGAANVFAVKSAPNATQNGWEVSVSGDANNQNVDVTVWVICGNA
jgi:hypothetical protein